MPWSGEMVTVCWVPHHTHEPVGYVVPEGDVMGATVTAMVLHSTEYEPHALTAAVL